MRRIAVMLSVPLAAAAVLAGCSSGSSSSSAPSSPAPSSSASSSSAASTPAVTPPVSVSGSFGQKPVVNIPAKKPGSGLVVKTLVQGSGPVLQRADAFVCDYALYVWSGKTHRLLSSSYATKTPAPAVFSGTLLPGLETALIGKKMGSRVLAVVPPKQGFGSSGNPQAGIKPTDTLVFIVDMIKKFPANESASGTRVSHGGGTLPTVTAKQGSGPSIKVPSSKPPSKLVTKVLIKGHGPAVKAGQTLAVQYVGVIWRTGKVFDSTWSRGQPFGFTLDATPSQVISGWDKGLTGQTVGSRVMLVIPPADGYGSGGNSSAGIKGTDTLVFVVDILGAFGG